MKSYQIVSKVLRELAKAATPGMNCLVLEMMAASLIEELGGKSYNRGYKPVWAKTAYPSVLSVNVNHYIAHGIPVNYNLINGDIISIDLGIIDSEGYCGDAAHTIAIGDISNEKQRLIRVAQKALFAGIQQVKNGVSTRDISIAIERCALTHNMRVNTEFSGHGIGKEMHMLPHIYNSCEDGHEYETLKTGQIICIEPMVTTGKDNKGGTAPDGWTRVTRDMKPSAVFEHMVEVTDDGYKILTDHFDWQEGITE